MLHLEVFKGDGEAWYATTGDEKTDKMKHVPDANYNRRADLLDPTWSKYLK